MDIKKETYFKRVSKNKLVVFLHGYKGSKNELRFLRDYILEKMHFSYFSFNYGNRNNKNEIINIKDAIGRAEKVVKKFLSNHNFKQIFLIGYSLGAGVIVKIAHKKSIKFNGAILISVFDDLKQLLNQRGINLIDEDNICPADLIKSINKSVVLIHGKNDTSISIQKGLNVYNNSNKKKTLFLSINTGHHFKDYGSRKKLCVSIKKALSFLLN